MPVWNRAKKELYFEKVTKMLDSYSKVFIVGVDNVGSKQMMQIRKALRGSAEVLMGKNTRVKKCLQGFLKTDPDHPIGCLMNLITGNTGLVFTNSDLGRIREILEENRVPAPARVGAIAPNDVIVPAGPTGCDPGQTSFFQTLQIATKISKGAIEITTDVHLLSVGQKVGNSEAVLLQKLGINPFTYGLVIQTIYDNGATFSPKVLDLSEDDLAAKFQFACSQIAAISLQIGYPTQCSVPHSIANAFRTVVSLVVGLDTYSFEKADMYKLYLKDPSAFASAGGGGGGGGGDAPKEEEKKVEAVEEEIDMGGAMDMFGGGGDDGY